MIRSWMAYPCEGKRSEEMPREESVVEGRESRNKDRTRSRLVISSVGKGQHVIYLSEREMSGSLTSDGVLYLDARVDFKESPF